MHRASGRISGGSRRGQMFVVTAIFLAGLIFAVQSMAFQYLSVDSREGFMLDEYGIAKGVRDAVDATVAGSPDCGSLGVNMKLLRRFIETQGSDMGYLTEFGYSLDCSAFGSNPVSPVPLLNVSIRVLGGGKDSTSRLSFYKTASPPQRRY